MLNALKNWWHQEELCLEEPELELAVAKLMVGMMAIDGEPDADEHKEIKHSLMSRFEMSDAEAEDVIVQALDEGRSDLRFDKVVKQISEKYSIEERASILTQIWRVAFADGEIDFNEEQYINRLSGLIAVPATVLSNLKAEQEEKFPHVSQVNRHEPRDMRAS